MTIRIPMIALALAAAFAMPTAAAAVPATTNASAEGLILVPLTLTKLEDLSFGDVIPSGVSGTVTINAGTGARSFTGGVTGPSGASGNRAEFATAGSPSQQVVLAVTPPTELVSTSNAADTIPVLALTLEGSPIRTIDPVTRTLFFGVGGVLQINADQPEGVYEAEFSVTAVYL